MLLGWGGELEPRHCRKGEMQDKGETAAPHTGMRATKGHRQPKTRRELIERTISKTSDALLEA